MNGADALARRLVDHGLGPVFGLPGEENLALVEALNRVGIELIVTRHEQHAAFMAATHGRLTGRPGICLATLGPGATNLFTGLAHAELGGFPMLAITGQKARRDNNEGSFQVLDIPAAARPLTRWSTSIDDPRSIVPTIDEAISRAVSGRPGAVLVELPEDVAGELVEARPNPVVANVANLAHDSSITAAAAAINAAKQVVVLTSAGANDLPTAKALVAFAEHTGIGVLATQLGKGSFPESHPASYRSLGIHRPDYAHLAIEPADLVIAVGYSPVEHPPLAWNPDEDKTIIHLASWRAAIERGFQPAHQLVGDIAPTLESLRDAVTKRETSTVRRARHTIELLLDEEDEGRSFPPSPLAIVRSVRRVLASTDVVALDNGVFKIWFARHYPSEIPNTLLLDNALATMGAGLAMATEAARLDGTRRVVAVCGDGGFLMNVQDLETACRLELSLTILVLRDDAYGFIGWHQEEQGRPRQDVSLGNPDISALAAAFGASAHQVTEQVGLDQLLPTAVAERGVSVIDCPIGYAINAILATDLYGLAKQRFEDRA